MGGLRRSHTGESLTNRGSSEKVEGQVKGRFAKARPKKGKAVRRWEDRKQQELL